MLYLYAIAEPGSAAPARPGLDGGPLVVLAESGVAAVCSEHDGAPPAPTAEAVRAHAAVVEALADAGAALPARYGTAFAGEETLRRELAARSGALRAALARVRGRVELGVRVLSPDAQPEQQPAPDGRTYLLRRLEEQRRTRAVADGLHRALAAGAAAATVRVGGGGPLLLSSAYLVGRDDVDALREQVDTLAHAHPELEVLCTGPWPPYSFAALEEDEP